MRKNSTVAVLYFHKTDYLYNVPRLINKNFIIYFMGIIFPLKFIKNKT